MENVLADSVNLIDPDTGEIGSLPAAQAQEALSQGFEVATPEQTDRFIQEQKYGGLGQAGIAALEGAAQAATFGGSTAIEKALGVPEEDILGRREIQSVPHMVGQGVGLVGSSLLVPGGGAAGLMERAGAAGAEALGLTGTRALSKIGSVGVKNAIETMMVQGGDEVSKMLASDPNQSVDTALTNIGLSGLIGGGIGGAIGSINPLWTATVGPRVARALEAFQGKAGGIEGLAPDVVEDMVQKLGIEISPEMKGALLSNPETRQMFQTLQESSTRGGQAAQEAYKSFKNDLGDAVLNTFGKSADDIEGLVHLSEYDAGRAVQKSLISDLKQEIGPISKQYEDISSRFKNIELPKDRTVYPAKTDVYTGAVTQEAIRESGTISKIMDDIAKLSEQKGYSVSPSSPEAQMLSRIQTELPNIKSLEDLRNYQSIVSGNATQKQMWGLSKDLRTIFRNAEEDLITSQLGKEAPELLAQHAATRESYKSIMNVMDDLNSRLHVGRYSGPESFVRALSEMSPEDVLRRLSGKGDADLLGVLQGRFPNVANDLRDYQIRNLLKNAAQKAKPGEVVNAEAFIKSYEKMSPELRSFVLGSEGQGQLEAVKELMKALPSKMNTSGTAKTLDALWSKIPASAVAMAQLAFGHNPILALPLAYLTNLVGREVPDAARLAMLRFLGSEGKVSASGFKAAADFIQNAIKGESLINKSVKSVFKAGSQVLPQAVLPTTQRIDRLNKRLLYLQKNIDPLMDTGGDVPHYLPETGTILAQRGGSAVQYLNSLRPEPKQISPLDRPLPPTEDQKMNFKNALEIAEQPLVVMDKIKSGTLTEHDMVHLNNLYPALVQKFRGQLTANLMEAAEKGTYVPYKTRMGLSLFLGQPLDSTMLPESIQAAQLSEFTAAPSQQSGQPAAPIKHKTAALNKLAPMYATGSQARLIEKTMK